MNKSLSMRFLFFFLTKSCINTRQDKYQWANFFHSHKNIFRFQFIITIAIEWKRKIKELSKDVSEWCVSVTWQWHIGAFQNAEHVRIFSLNVKCKVQ